MDSIRSRVLIFGRRRTRLAIEYIIDRDQRVVFARAHGALSRDDLLTYQREVWAGSDLREYNELTDLTELLTFAYNGDSDIREVAGESILTDDPKLSTRVAIVAPTPFADELARRYRDIRMSIPGSNRELRVFAGRREALEWLKVREPDVE